VFVETSAVSTVVTRLLDVARGQDFAVVVYCLMPDHMHALLEGLADDADFRECVRVFKQCTSFEWKRVSGAKLWQRSYFDRILRADEDTISVARYILENPVRAKLVKDPLEYPFLGSATMDVRDLMGSLTP
jgi:REP element-mobilizing transposase RayT